MSEVELLDRRAGNPLYGAVRQGAVLAMLRRFDDADAVLRVLQKEYPSQPLEREFEPWRLPDEVPEDGLAPTLHSARALSGSSLRGRKGNATGPIGSIVLAEIGDLAQDALRYGFVAGLEPHRLLSLPIDPGLQLAVARAQSNRS
ncbi:MAG: hypothetical protein MZW92_09305 [Comamonadaceae bacterium]|nr:hypothetical protein [Comamonadaceae bacterium]